MAVSLYRKYRPEVFADVVGQQHVVGTLLNAVKSNNVAHAYLFCGPRGTGKTTTARLLAKALMCDDSENGAPCGKCEACCEIAKGSFPDVYELDAASRTGVENVREEIISRVNFAPTRGKCKIYIIDEVHMLSTAAFNALLKTLEEPPAHVYFVLCTTDPHKVIATIQSRCQRFDFHRFSIEEIVTYLRRICDAEDIAAETEALQAIAVKSNGGMRDATTALEQTIIACDDKITLEAVYEQFGQGEISSGSGLFDIAAFIAKSDVKGVFAQLDCMATEGVDFKIFASDLALHMRNVYVAALTNTDQNALDCPQSDIAKYKHQVELFADNKRIAWILSECGELMKDLRGANDARLTTEIALMRMSGQGVAAPDVQVGTQQSQVASSAAVANQARSSQVKQKDVPHSASYLNFTSSEAAPSTVSANAVPAAVSSDVVPGKTAQTFQVSVSQQNTVATPALKKNVKPTPAPQAAQSFQVPVPKSVAQSTQASESKAGSNAQSVQTSSDSKPVQTSDPMHVPPAHAAVSMATSTAPKTDMSLPRLQAAFVTAVKSRDIPTGTLLDEIHLKEVDGMYIVVWPDERKFALTLAKSPDASRIINSAFTEVLGAPAELSFKLESDRFPTTSTPGNPPRGAHAIPHKANDVERNSGQPAIPKNIDTVIDEQVDKEMAEMLSAFGEGIQIEKIEE